jgi:hypothetical protein
MAITLGLVEAVDDNGVYVSMPGSRGVLRGPFRSLSTVVEGTTVLMAVTDDGEQMVVGPSEGGLGAVSVSAFGAKGDDDTDDTAAIQSAINAVDTGGTVVIPAGTYKITAALTVATAVTITGTGTIHQTASAHGFTVTADNVTIEGITLTGRHSGTVTLDVDEDAIHVFGASAAAPISNVTVRDVTISGWGMYGVQLKWVEGFTVANCRITRIGYAGVSATSSVRGLVCRNEISTISPGSSGDMYGVALSRDETDSLTTDPHCSDIVVQGNVVEGVAWEALDTHGGQRITFSGNVIRNCYVGVAVVGSDDSTNTTMWAPRDVVVSDNVIDSGADDGSAGYGISIAGAPGATSADPAVEYATCSVTGNTIRGHGTEDNSISGAIYARNTEGLVVSGNVIERPSPFGICLYYDNRGFAVVGNTMTDAWSDTVLSPSAVASLAENNVGTIAGNSLRDGDKSATYTNVHGVNNTGGATTAITFGFNNFAAAANIASATTGLQPNITGSRGGNAALASLLTALHDLGLIMNNSS